MDKEGLLFFLYIFGVFNSGHDNLFKWFVVKFASICSIVCYINHFKHVLVSMFAHYLNHLGLAYELVRHSSTRHGQQSQGWKIADLSQDFKQMVLLRATSVLFRTNKSDKINDQPYLAFVNRFTGIYQYLQTHFSLTLIIREIWKSYILLHENTQL